MTRGFLQPDQLGDLVAEQFGTGRRLAALDRLTGGTKKGVYRLRLDDNTIMILYVWAAGENYWPPAPTVLDDPFTDASGAELFAVNHAALSAAGVRTPQLHFLDRDGRYLGADIALVEDVGECVSRRCWRGIRSRPALRWPPSLKPCAACTPRLVRSTAGPRSSPSGSAAGSADRGDHLDRALGHLDAAAARDARLAEAHARIVEHVRELAGAVAPRQRYVLVHGELGPDHVFVTPTGEPVLIDIEGLTYFDVEWEHAWLQMRFGDAYPALRPVDVDADRLELYRYAQVLSLIEGPLRIATPTSRAATGCSAWPSGTSGRR